MPLPRCSSFASTTPTSAVVELTVFAENSRARLCYLKAGFIEEGVARQKTWKNGKFHDIGCRSSSRARFPGR